MTERVWIVWAIKPGEPRVAAICTTEEKADYYINDNIGVIYPGYKLFKESVPLDHAFGRDDGIQSLMYRKR